MLDFEMVSQFQFGDIMICYLKKDEVYLWTILPVAKFKEIPAHRRAMKDTRACQAVAAAFNYDFPAVTPESMIQYKIAGDGYFAQHAPGNSLRNSDSILHLAWVGQQVVGNQITTTFKDGRNLKITHQLTVGKNAQYLVVNTKITNESSQSVKLEYAASFSLGMLSMFQPDAGPEAYLIHRYRSNWSAEGRRETATAEALGLESSWQGAGLRSLRFGQRSSMPVKSFYPAVAFEDVKAQVCWGVRLAAFSPWELEVSRIGDYLNISGGQIARDSVGWSKILQPGESFAGPEAALSCVAGNIDQLDARLMGYFDDDLLPQPEVERDFPIIFNEWCTTWGHPTVANLRPIAQKIQTLGVKYFVLDDGWFRSEVQKEYNLGDWVESVDKYPQGLAAFCRELRELGFIPGIWFEFENVMASSRCAVEHPEWLLQLDGEILKVGERRFLDFRKKVVWDYLDDKVIAMLKRNQIGYMKVDYNAAIPFGVDGADSLPENLRAHLAGVAEYFAHLRRELPDLVLEICASGGHRLSPWWLRLGAMGSFSDAHEGVEIPLIASSLSRLIPAKKSQIWAVVRPADDEKRLYYSLAATFMGRCCLSGELAELSPEQTQIIQKAMAFYPELKNLLKSGENHIYQSHEGAWNTPQGFQVVQRENADEELIIVHTFADAPGHLSIKLTAPEQVKQIFAPQFVKWQMLSPTEIELQNLSDFTGLAILLDK